jgi:large subunit ribosomal protein L6
MNYNNLKKKHTIKIPKNISALYCDKKNLLTFLGPLQKKSLKIEVKVFLIPSTNLIVVSDLPIYKTSNVGLKSSKSMQGTTIAKIKQILIEITYTLHHKLELVGVGYRAFPLETLNNQLYFKLGYSHLIYFKVPEFVETHCIKFTKLFIFGNSSYEEIMQTAALIRDCKKPEPYKGKGILHHGEKITLKKGKKI